MSLFYDFVGLARPLRGWRLGASLLILGLAAVGLSTIIGLIF